MAYDYVRTTYGVDPKVGARVQHTVTKNFGRIAREDTRCSNYVKVRFEGRGHSDPCHPTELDYAPISPCPHESEQ